MQSLYFFGWPDHVGGATTKLAHLLALLAPHYHVTVIPDDDECFGSEAWVAWMKHIGAAPARLKDLPDRLTGWAIALCHGEFFSKGMAAEAKGRGLRIAWSSEMMWLYKAERLALFCGVPDVVLYVSEVQRTALEPHYWYLWNGGQRPENLPPQSAGYIPGVDRRPPLRWVMTGNFISPACFPFVDRSRERRFPETVVGRLSRADPLKFPVRFPNLYEALDCGDTRFRVMAWDKKMSATWPEYRFGRRWDLLEAMEESQHRFLQSLDVFAYGLGTRFKESWGRVAVEAMLCGAVPLVPRGDGHHLDQLVPHGLAGFTFGSDEEFIEYGRLLVRDEALRMRMSVAAREWAETKLCDAADHLVQWRRVFDFPPQAPTG